MWLAISMDLKTDTTLTCYGINKKADLTFFFTLLCKSILNFCYYASFNLWLETLMSFDSFNLSLYLDHYCNIFHVNDQKESIAIIGQT